MSCFFHAFEFHVLKFRVPQFQRSREPPQSRAYITAPIDSPIRYFSWRQSHIITNSVHVSCISELLLEYQLLNLGSECRVYTGE